MSEDKTPPDTKDNVVFLSKTIQKRQKEEPFLGLHVARKPDAKFCMHHSTEIDSNTQSFTCCTCGAKVDPYMWIERNCAGNISWITSLRAERNRLLKEVAELKEERTKLKSSVDGLKKRRGVKP